MIDFLRQFFKFVLLLLLQVLVFSKLQLGPYFYPCAYILFIILMPGSSSSISCMLAAFAMGLLVDFFSCGVVGIHTCSAVTLAYLRGGVLRLSQTADEVHSMGIPGSYNMGWANFITYLIICVIIHQTVFLVLENLHTLFQVRNIIRFCASTLLNILLMIILVPLFTPGKE